MVMSKAVWVTLALLISWSACAQSLTYRVEASLLSKQGRQGKKPGEIVEITLPGLRFDPPVEMAVAAKSAADRTTPEGLLRSMRSANLAGDADWLAENFAQQDQPWLRKMLMDPSVLEKSRKYYSTVVRMLAMETVMIREYTIVVVREERKDGHSTKPVTMIHTPQGWRATNDLASDPTLDVVWMAVANR
jgi:hypothetical protein